MSGERYFDREPNKQNKDLKLGSVIAATSLALIALANVRSSQAEQNGNFVPSNTDNYARVENQRTSGSPIDFGDEEKIAVTAGIITFYGWQLMTSAKALENGRGWHKWFTYGALAGEAAPLSYAIYKVWS